MSNFELARASLGQPSAEEAGVALTRALGVQDLAGARAMDPQVLTDAAMADGFYPQATIDGWILPRQMVEAFDRGEQARVPIIAGFNAGEVRSLRFFLPPLPQSAQAYEQRVRHLYRDLAPRYLQRYPGGDIEGSALAAARDAFYGWSAERLVRAQAALGLPAYLYYFDHEYPAAAARELRAFHGSELPYLFGLIGSGVALPRNWPPPPDEASERALSNALMEYFTSFARNAVPSAGAQPHWPPFSEGRAFLHVRDRAYAEHDLLPGMFALHEEIVARRRASGTQNWSVNIGLASPVLPEA
jgi:para-nitrobenzyl esterase